MSPFDGQRAAQMADSGLGCVVWGLWLRDVDDRSTHAANEDHAAWALSLHQVSGNASGEEVSSVDVDCLESALRDTAARTSGLLPPQSFLTRS